ncbi:MAG: hypothetical protein M3Q07_20025 [Pseudobdellovibrionaceae bacterium]|nr:hypothetical protein [Pseudobdellovibrionaceae bacterium]
MKHYAWCLLLGLGMGCQDKSSSGGPGPVINPEPECSQVLQRLQLNESLKLTDLDSTTLFIKNNAQALQQMEAEQAATVWACLEKG